MGRAVWFLENVQVGNVLVRDHSNVKKNGAVMAKHGLAQGVVLSTLHTKKKIILLFTSNFFF